MIIGKMDATKVEVFATRLVRVHNGREKPVPAFLPGYMKWSDSEREAFHARIGKGASRYFDLFHVVKPDRRGELNYEELPDSGERAALLSIDRLMKTFDCNHLAGPGEYLLHLEIGADNVGPRRVVVRIDARALVWHDDPQAFKRSLGISVQKAPGVVKGPRAGA